MTQSEIAQAFREIDNQAAEARRTLNAGEDRQVVSGYLVAIQLTAQGALRKSPTDPEIQAMDYAAGDLDQMNERMFCELHCWS